MLDIRREWLSGRLVAMVSDRHTFGADAFLLASFTPVSAGDVVCDLGCGCGILSLLLERKGRPRRLDGVDLQPEAVSLAEQAAAESGLQQKMRPRRGDLRTIACLFPPGQHSLVVCNPPYFLPVSANGAPPTARHLARQEVTCTFSEVAAASAYLLSPGGRFCFCHRPQRLWDVVTAAGRDCRWSRPF